MRPDRFVAALASPQEVSDVTQQLAQVRRARRWNPRSARRSRHEYITPQAQPTHVPPNARIPRHVALAPAAGPEPGQRRGTSRRSTQRCKRRAAWYEFAPELIVLIAPDHYNGFFNELMPTFCIGTEATAVGDYLSPAGPLNVPQDKALALATHLMDSNFDMAVSRRMLVDHGCRPCSSCGTTS